jgi:hypothetical protein
MDFQNALRSVQLFERRSDHLTSLQFLMSDRELLFVSVTVRTRAGDEIQ